MYNNVIFPCKLVESNILQMESTVPTMAIVIMLFNFNASPDEFLGRIEIVIGMHKFCHTMDSNGTITTNAVLEQYDYSLVCALAIMGLIVVSHCITNRIFKAGNEELAILLDTWFMVVIVVSYIGTQIFLSLRIRKFMRGSSLRKYKESNDSMNARVTVKEAWYCDLGDEKYKDFKLRTMAVMGKTYNAAILNKNIYFSPGFLQI